MLVCLSADLPNSLLLAPASSSLSLVFKTNPRFALNCVFGLPASNQDQQGRTDCNQCSAGSQAQPPILFPS
ncbi:hypothetical protein FJTKL_06535 [Diaporthe vaccinii]|uniref:Uncharacterized protein n=1 Tax=Diaporthe vaccinii TaxID=105482 RepID=A0ABR4DQ52_9PEZI